MSIYETIRSKRNGAELSREQIADFIAQMTIGQVSEGQIGAFAMAVWFRGMTRAETVALTCAMRDSGDVLQWGDVDRPVVDKHSTGGIGDNVSLMLAPLMAACGLAVPMISGRGLGHTGGTLDKLESIPGYEIKPSADLFRTMVKTLGCAIIGQTDNLAPADKLLYAVRDVTATVDSMPLITASILSKKLAAGLQNLVLDVKIGTGAFMTSLEEAEGLATSLVEVANGAGVKTTALITDMNEPLADAVGNAVEIVNCLDFLKGRKRGTRLERVVMNLACDMLMSSGVENDPDSARNRALKALDTGHAMECFARMITMLGGPADFVERYQAYLPKASVIRPIFATSSGYLSACKASDLGMAVIALGGGRKRPQDHIDHAVGFDRIVPLGTMVEEGDTLALVHASSAAAADAAIASFRSAYATAQTPPASTPIVVKRISSTD
jgi:thymidine phosphorylase